MSALGHRRKATFALKQFVITMHFVTFLDTLRNEPLYMTRRKNF